MPIIRIFWGLPLLSTQMVTWSAWTVRQGVVVRLLLVPLGVGPAALALRVVTLEHRGLSRPGAGHRHRALGILLEAHERGIGGH
jgi:hypothetical protein